MNDTFVEQITLKLVVCCECGIPFGIEADYQTRLHKNGESFFCPHGHGQWYGESEADQLKQLLKDARENSAWWEAAANATERRLSATRGVVTRLKRKIASGECPCCHNTFKTLAKHMERMHPDFEATEEIGE